MKSKFTLLITAVTCAMICAFGLVACGGDDDNTPPAGPVVYNYTVKSTVPQNCDVSYSGTSINKGDTFSVTLTPKTGYEIGTIKLYVSDAKTASQEITATHDQSSNNYSYEYTPTSDFEIEWQGAAVLKQYRLTLAKAPSDIRLDDMIIEFPDNDSDQLGFPKKSMTLTEYNTHVESHPTIPFTVETELKVNLYTRGYIYTFDKEYPWLYVTCDNMTCNTVVNTTGSGYKSGYFGFEMVFGGIDVVSNSNSLIFNNLYSYNSNRVTVESNDVSLSNDLFAVTINDKSVSELTCDDLRETETTRSVKMKVNVGALADDPAFESILNDLDVFCNGTPIYGGRDRDNPNIITYDLKMPYMYDVDNDSLPISKNNKYIGKYVISTNLFELMGKAGYIVELEKNFANSVAFKADGKDLTAGDIESAPEGSGARYNCVSEFYGQISDNDHAKLVYIKGEYAVVKVYLKKGTNYSKIKINDGEAVGITGSWVTPTGDYAFNSSYEDDSYTGYVEYYINIRSDLLGSVESIEFLSE